MSTVALNCFRCALLSLGLLIHLNCVSNDAEQSCQSEVVQSKEIASEGAKNKLRQQYYIRDDKFDENGDAESNPGDEIRFHAYLKLDDIESISSYLQGLDKNQLQMVKSINRLDLHRLKKSKLLIIPEKYPENLLALSPFPSHLPLAQEVQKLLIFSYPIQAFAAYEKGVLVRWGPTSLGNRKTPTPRGLFHTNWRARRRGSSTDNPDWTMHWYFNIHSRRGIAIHQYELPGYPDSHACIRLSSVDAKWIFHWADVWILTSDEQEIRAHGTPVIIFGSYDYQQPPPYLKLPADPHATDYGVDKLNEVVLPNLAKILQRQANRERILDRRRRRKGR